MAKSSPPASEESASWLTFTLSGLVGLLLGATGMYFLLLPKLTRSSGNAPASLVSAGATTKPESHLPPPDLTQGQSPALADRTRGNFYYDHQNWSEAIRHYESALKQGSDDADIRTDLGNCYRFTRRPDEALNQYLAAQRMDPAHEFSLFNQGGLYLEDLKQPAKAIAIWQEYLVRFPKGRNVVAAQQLIDQAQGVSPTAAPSRPIPADSTEEARLLRLMTPANSKP